MFWAPGSIRPGRVSHRLFFCATSRWREREEEKRKRGREERRVACRSCARAVLQDACTLQPSSGTERHIEAIKAPA